MNIFKPFRFLPKLEIEAQANAILDAMKEVPKYYPRYPLDASRVAEFLGLDVVWDRIPADETGSIAARILPLDYLIEINEDIPQLRGGFGESTIAHEIGHWVLHIDREAVFQLANDQKQGLKITVEPLLCRNASKLRGIEWQAQYFSSCLLMPESILQATREHTDLTCWRNLYTIADELGVTISNLVYRLQDLGWIHLNRDSRKITLATTLADEEYEWVYVEA